MVWWMLHSMCNTPLPTPHSQTCNVAYGEILYADMVDSFEACKLADMIDDGKCDESLLRHYLAAGTPVPRAAGPGPKPPSLRYRPVGSVSKTASLSEATGGPVPNPAP